MLKKVFTLLILTVLMLSSVAYAAFGDGCAYYQQHGVHNYRDLYWATEPTCTAIGVMWVECRSCGYTAIAPRNDSMLPHTYSSWTTVNPATEFASGTQTSNCDLCGKMTSREYYHYRTVHHGRDEKSIREMQDMLVQLGYLQAANGVYDAATEQALRTVQSEANFPITGIGYPQTLDYLQERLNGTGKAPEAQATEAPAATGTSSSPLGAQQSHCTHVDIEMGVATVYCARHQALNESCAQMMAVAQTDALKAEMLRMYRLVLENDLEEQYAAWHKDATAEVKQIASSHQKLSGNYLTMQELSWKIIYGADDIRVLENVVDALMQQCAELCLMIAQSTNDK